MSLSEQDREELAAAKRRSPNAHWIEVAVELIVARHVTAALTEAADAIEAKRNEHWQQHLREHPYADGTSCPRDYGQHDAFALSARIVRAHIPPPP